MSEPVRFSRRELLQTASAASAIPWPRTALAVASPAARPAVAMKSPHVVDVRPHRGRTGIFVDGRPIAGMAYLNGAVFGQDTAKDVFTREVAGTGMPIIFLGWNPGRASDAPGWPAPGKYDFSLFDTWASRVSAMTQDAWFVLRIYIDTPAWWAKQHPDELVRYAHAPDQVPVDRGESRRAVQASMASEPWIADVGDLLHALVAHVEGSQFAARILGYMIDSGGTEEWVYWGVQPGYIPDYSPPALRYFHAWLRHKYGPQAWIDEARIPSEAARRRGEPGMLRDPALDRLAIDYELCLSDIAADNLLAWCSVVKQATARKRLTGSFHSYVMWQTGLVNPAAANAHLGLRRLLEHPDIDFITGITSYDNREPGGPGSFMLPLESVQRAGKITFNEVDDRTHLVKVGSSLRYFATGLLDLGPLKDAAESVDVLRREFAHHLIHGSAWWYFDMAGGWYSCPEILAEFKKQAPIARAALDWDMTSVGEVAAIVSAPGPAYHPLMRMHDVNNYPRLLELQCDRATRELYRSGVLLDWLMTNDLEGKGLERYKVLFFYNATWLSQKQRDAVDALKRDGRVLIFVGYPGLATDSNLDVAAASRLVGLKFRLDNHRACAEITPRTYDDPVFREVKGKLVLGPGAVVGPRLLPDDDSAKVLAWWPDGAPAAAVKRGDGFTSYYFPVSPNNCDLFRTMCRDAGCFVYSVNNDILFANRSLLAVHFVDCIQPIALPRAHRVTNLFTGETIMENGRMLVPRGDGGTHLYRLE